MPLPQRCSHWHLSPIPEGAGRCVCKPQLLPRKVHIAHGMRSVFQKITVPGAPGLGCSWRLERLHSPGPGTQEGPRLVPGMVGRKPYSITSAARTCLQLYLYQGCDMSRLRMSKPPLELSVPKRERPTSETAVQAVWSNCMSHWLC